MNNMIIKRNMNNLKLIKNMFDPLTMKEIEMRTKIPLFNVELT